MSTNRAGSSVGIFKVARVHICTLNRGSCLAGSSVSCNLVLLLSVILGLVMKLELLLLAALVTELIFVLPKSRESWYGC